MLISPLQHFFASIDKAEADLGWRPEFGLVDGLRDSYEKDFGRGTFRQAKAGASQFLWL